MAVDILMGANAGTKTCGVTWGNGSRKDFQEAGADYIIDSMEELIEITEEWRLMKNPRQVMTWRGSFL